MAHQEEREERRWCLAQHRLWRRTWVLIPPPDAAAFENADFEVVTVVPEQAAEQQRDHARARAEKAEFQRDNDLQAATALADRLSWLESSEAVERIASALIPNIADASRWDDTLLHSIASRVRDALLEGERGAELRSRGRT